MSTPIRRLTPPSPNYWYVYNGPVFLPYSISPAVNYWTTSRPSFTYKPANGSPSGTFWRIDCEVLDKDGAISARLTGPNFTVVNEAPEVSAISGVVNPMYLGRLYPLTGAVTDAGGAGDIKNYAWRTYKNGSTWGSTVTTATYNFIPDSAGSYKVTLTVTDNSGATSVPCEVTFPVTDGGNQPPQLSQAPTAPAINELTSATLPSDRRQHRGNVGERAGRSHRSQRRAGIHLGMETRHCRPLRPMGPTLQTGSTVTDEYFSPDNGTYTVTVTARDPRHRAKQQYADQCGYRNHDLQAHFTR